MVNGSHELRSSPTANRRRWAFGLAPRTHHQSVLRSSPTANRRRWSSSVSSSWPHAKALRSSPTANRRRWGHCDGCDQDHDEGEILADGEPSALAGPEVDGVDRAMVVE